MAFKFLTPEQLVARQRKRDQDTEQRARVLATKENKHKRTKARNSREDLDKLFGARKP
jgi:hypothetical protein